MELQQRLKFARFVCWKYGTEMAGLTDRDVINEGKQLFEITDAIAPLLAADAYRNLQLLIQPQILVQIYIQSNYLPWTAALSVDC